MRLATPKEVFPSVIPVAYQSGMNMIREGLIDGVVRIGRRVFIDLDELEAFAKSGGKALAGGWRREPK